MKRALRTGATVLCVGSLLLCAATAALWVRSYFASDSLDWGTRTGRAGMYTFRGHVGVGWLSVAPSDFGRIRRNLSYRAESSSDNHPGGLRPGWSSWTGVQVTRIHQPGFSISDASVPDWLLMLATGLPAGAWLVRHRRVPLPGHCPRCGSDLRATRERCPECGTPVT